MLISRSALVNLLAVLALPTPASAWTMTSTLRPTATTAVQRHRSVVADFGDKFYLGAQEELPQGVYEVAIEKPLGIQFEEKGPIVGKNGVTVIGLLDGGNAEKSGKVKVGDDLVGVTAIQFIGAKFERKMFDATKWDFDTVVDAIGSNEPKFDCYDVICQFKRPSE